MNSEFMRIYGMFEWNFFKLDKGVRLEITATLAVLLVDGSVSTHDDTCWKQTQNSFLTTF